VTDVRRQTEIGEFPEDWEFSTLARICGLDGCIQTGPFGSQLHANEYAADGVPVINPTHLEGNRINHAHVPRVSEETSHRLDRHRVKKGDILFGRRGELGRHGLVTDSEAGWLCGTGCFLVRIRNPKVDNAFLSYLFSTNSVLNWLQARAAGSIMPNLNNTVLSNLPVAFPTIVEQREVVAILDKIRRAVDVETAICERLEALKSATMTKLFREGLRGEPLKRTEIGEIPQSWQLVRLGDIARIGNGSTPKRTNAQYWLGGRIPWITSTKIHDVLIDAADEFVTDMAFRECHLPMVPKGSLLVAITGQGKTLGNAALLQIDTCINQHLAYVQFQIPSALPEFFLFYLRSLYSYFRQISSSGGSTKGALTCGFIANLMVPMPSESEQKEIAELFLRLADRQMVAKSRSAAMSSLYETSLPQLTTGFLRVKNEHSGEVVNA